MTLDIGDYVRISGTLTAWEGQCGFIVQFSPMQSNVAVVFTARGDADGWTAPIWFSWQSVTRIDLPEEKLIEALGEEYFA